MAPIETGHCPSIKPDELRPALREFRPTFLVGVPYLFEKIHDTGRATAERIGRGASFDRADRVAVRFGAAYLDRFLGRGKGPGPGLYAAWALYDLLVYRRIRKELGGRLRYAISGRKKDILITSGGKNVSPAVLEDRLRSRPPVGQCVVVGDNRPFIAALVTLDPESVAHWLAVRQLPAGTPLADVVRDPRMRADVQKAVDYANEAVSRAESIRAFVLVEGEFNEENGMLTPSLKVKRHAVTAAYSGAVEELYRG